MAELFDISGTEQEPAIVLRVVAHPGAGRTSVVGTHGDALRVKVGAPPVGNRANEALVELLGHLFGVKKDQIEITSGQTSRTKRVRLTGLRPEEARHLLDQALAQAGASSSRKSGPAPLQRRV